MAELERRGDPLSHVILRGLAHLGTRDLARRSADAAARLGEQGVGLRRAFADVGGARATGAWRASEAGGDYALFVEFEHPLGAAHSIALFVEPRRGGVVKHIALLHAMNDLDLDDPFYPSGMDTVEIPTGAALLREVLDRSFGPEAAGTDDFRVLIAAARARSAM